MNQSAVRVTTPQCSLLFTGSYLCAETPADRGNILSRYLITPYKLQLCTRWTLEIFSIRNAHYSHDGLLEIKASQHESRKMGRVFSQRKIVSLFPC